MVLSPLPASFQLLKKLQTLYLDRCHLRDIAEIGNLKNLKILVLSSDIERLPEQLGELTQLKVLDLRKCSDIEVIPPNTISRLTQLEELYMPSEFCKWQVDGVDGERSNVSLGELEHLSQLTALQIYIPDAKLVPKGLLFQKLQRYKIYIGNDGWGFGYDTSRKLVLKYDDANISVEDGIIKQLKEIEDLQLIGKQDVKNVIYELIRDGFPKLKHFDVESNPELVYIVDFPKQSEPCVAFPHLQTLFLIDLSSLEKICHGQFTLTPNSFCQLRTIRVERCVKLKNIFSSSIARHLSQLERIEVFDCENMEEIFSIVGSENEEIVLENFVCSKTRRALFEITSLINNFLSSTFFADNYTVLEEIIRIDHDLKNNVELPSLTNLKIEECPAMKSFIFSDKVTFPSLEEIKISDMDNLEMIWQTQFEDSLNLQCYPKLSKMTATNCHSLKNLFTASIARNLSQLKQLYVKNCGINAFVFGDKVTFPSLEEIKSLYVTGLGNLKQIWKQDSKVDTILQNLESLVVRTCGGLVTLLPPSTSFQNLTVLRVQDCRLITLISSSTAKSLMQLKEMEIKDCNMMAEVVIGDGAGMEDEINFKNLKSLELISLSTLRRFCSGNYNFNFPSLEILKVENCPKMLIFCSKTTNTPMLRKIELDWESYYCNGDVNKTMERIHKKKVFSSRKLILSANEIKMILQKFPEHKFSKVQTLVVFDDESTVFPLDILQRFQNLNQLQLSNTSYKEIFSCEEVEKHAETLAQIKHLRLEKLDDLEQMWKQDSRSDLILHNLGSLEVVECNSLITLVPTSASFQNLRFMRVSDCNGLRSLVTAAVAKSLVQLWCMWISNCNEMTEIVANGDVKEDEIIFNNLEELELTNLSNLTSFYSGNYTLNFPSLNELQVTRCPKMKFFSSGISSTPMLQQIEWGSNLSNLTSFYSGNCTLNFTSLDELLVTRCPKMKFFSSGISSTTMLQQIEWGSTSFQNLRFMRVSDCNGLRSLVTAAVAKSLVQLERMRIKNCNEMTEIVANSDVKEDEIIFNKLEKLKLIDLSNLTSFYPGNYTLNFPSLTNLKVTRCPKMKFFSSGISIMPMLQQIGWGSTSFQNLRFMRVSDCNGLRSLVTAAVAKSLVQLERMRIKNCNEMTEIVANSDVKEDEIIFNKLEKLKLIDLSNLTNFYSGNYTLNFPSLYKLEVTRCPKMKFFSSGISSTPMLQQIKRGSSSEVVVVWIDGDGQSISENVENSMEDCAGASTQHLELEMSIEKLKEFMEKEEVICMLVARTYGCFSKR
ncbi:hypothetical protein EZV62_004473 [Acer yangbiense]|uniref:Disease resistance protein At4g27190-like leucine-rich repeats domain-containing protein n=1 Tax=Acer yangbiense TaxID=1000413 RepID=A0A5C7IK16_9ROSI|nr:hypothetical protein EZV62_004473 [Acer yangbiense]